MNGKKFIFILVCIICIICITSTVIAANLANTETENTEQDTSWLGMNKAIDSYDYSFLYDNAKKWEEYAAMDITGKYEICQIPEDIISKISTEGLIRTCLDCPLFGNIFAFNSIQVGYNRLAENFNGLRALNERKDAGEILLQMYKDMNFDLLLKSEQYPIIKLNFFNVMVSQDLMLNNINKEQRAELAKIIVDKINIISEKYSDTFSIGTQIILLDTVLEKDNISFEEYTKNNANIADYLNKCRLL